MWILLNQVNLHDLNFLCTVKDRFESIEFKSNFHSKIVTELRNDVLICTL